jgi:hypothetical protein
MRVAEDVVYGSFLRSDITATIQGYDHIFVECGFARYKDEDCTNACVTEPLVLLAATHRLEMDRKSAGLRSYVSRNIQTLTGSKSNGFESYLAFIIAELFGKPAPLKNVFKFLETPTSSSSSSSSYPPSPPAWANQSARLVALQRRSEGDPLSIQCVDWSGKSFPSGWLGINADPEETLEWLNNPNGVPVLYPDNNIG